MRRQHSSAARVSTRKRRCSSASLVYSVGRAYSASDSTRYTGVVEPGRRARQMSTRYSWRPVTRSQALQRLDARRVELVAPDLRIERHEQPHVVPGAVSWRDSALATSASPPLLASGTTSDAMAQIDSFTAAGILALGVALVALQRFTKVSNSMRRVLTFLTAAVLLLVSLGVGVFTADLPFWRRALQLPLPADGAYLPVAVIGAPGTARPGESAPANDRVRRPGGRGVGQSRARRRFARLVSHVSRPPRRRALFRRRRRDTACCRRRWSRGRWRRWRWASRSPTGASPRSTAPVARYLPEWDDEARGRITLRQLLEETSGLETGGDIRGLLYRSPWSEPARPAGVRDLRGVRMLLGNDFESSALGFRLDHEPGGFYNLSPANTQLAAVIVERVTGEPYENLRRRARCGAPVGAGSAELQLDRRAGMPAAHCCWRATARDMLRMLSLLGTDGVHDRDARCCPPAGCARWRGPRASTPERHAGRAAQYRRRRSARSHGRRWQRVLGDSAAGSWPSSTSRIPGGSSRAGTSRAAAEGACGRSAAR